MAWAKVDDDAPLSRKFFRAGVAAFGFDVSAWCYSNREGTDGFIPARDLQLVFPGERLSKLLALAVRLVESERWSAGEKDGVPGWFIHDFHQFQFSAEQVAERKKKRAEAGRLGGIRSGETRRSKQPSRDEANASRFVEANANPVPVPVPRETSPERAPVDNCGQLGGGPATDQRGGCLSTPGSSERNGESDHDQALQLLASAIGITVAEARRRQREAEARALARGGT